MHSKPKCFVNIGSFDLFSFFLHTFWYGKIVGLLLIIYPKRNDFPILSSFAFYLSENLHTLQKLLKLGNYLNYSNLFFIVAEFVEKTCFLSSPLDFSLKKKIGGILGNFISVNTYIYSVWDYFVSFLLSEKIISLIYIKDFLVYYRVQIIFLPKSVYLSNNWNSKDILKVGHLKKAFTTFKSYYCINIRCPRENVLSTLELLLTRFKNWNWMSEHEQWKKQTLNFQINTSIEDNIVANKSVQKFCSIGS